MPQTSAAVYLNTETVGITCSKQPDAIVGEAVDHLLGQVGLLLLTLLLQVKVTAVRSILQGKAGSNWATVRSVAGLGKIS